MKKHILVYSQYFYPEQFRINDICINLVNKGFKVSVVTGIPNYPEGKFYEGYSFKNKRYENWKGIDIYRIPIIPRGKNKISLVLNYLSFVINAKIKEKKLPQNVDLIFTYEVSPMTQALPAIWNARKKNIPHIIYVMDLWPDNVIGVTGLSSKIFIKPLDKMVDYIYEHSKTILTSSRNFKTSIEKRGVPKEKIKFWPQYAEDLYQIVPKENKKITVNQYKVPTFVFAGNLGEGQGLDLLPKTAKKLKTKNIRVKFILIGDGRAKQDIINMINQNNVKEYFEFINRQPAEMIPYYLAKYDFGLVILNDNKIFNKTIPAKVQSLMACGMPMLVSANGEIQDVISEADCGLVSNAGDISGFVNNIREAITMTEEEKNILSTNAINYNNKYFNKDKLILELAELFEEEK